MPFPLASVRVEGVQQVADSAARDNVLAGEVGLPGRQMKPVTLRGLSLKPSASADSMWVYNFYTAHLGRRKWRSAGTLTSEQTPESLPTAEQKAIEYQK